MKGSLIVNRIKAFYAGLGPAQIAKIAGLADHTSLRSYKDPKWNPTLKTVEKLMAPIPEDWEIGDLGYAAKNANGHEAA